MVEYMTQEQARQRSGMAFFEAEGRLDRLLFLAGSVMSTSRDEVWVSALDAGSEHVVGGRILGMPVCVTFTMPAGEMWMWSDSRKEFLS